MHRHGLTQRVVRGVARCRVPSHQRQSLDHRPVRVVAGAELQHVQQLDQPAPVVVGIRRLQRRLHRAPVDRTAGLELVHQLPQRLLTAGHRRVDDLTDRALRLADRRLGELEEDFLLARHLLERVDQLLGDLLLSPRPDPVNRGDQQLHQRVRDLPLTLVQQRGQQRHPQRQRVRAQMGRGLHCGSCPPSGHHLRRDVREQVRRQPDRANRKQLVDLREHRLQAQIARSLLDLPQDRRPVLALTSTGITGHRVVLPISADDQGHDPLDALHRDPCRDPRRQRLLGSPQRCGHDPVAPPRGGRLDALRSAAGQQFHPHLLRPPLLARDVVDEPGRQLVRIRDTALTKAQVPADLRTVVLNRPTAPLIRVQLGRRYLYLPSDELHRLARQLDRPRGNRPYCV